MRPAMQAAIRAYAEDVRRVPRHRGANAPGAQPGSGGAGYYNDLHMDYSAIGQTTHLAARMEQLATPGTILLTAATLHLVEGLVRATAMGPVPVKGLDTPVEVFELVGASALRAACRRAWRVA